MSIVGRVLMIYILGNHFEHAHSLFRIIFSSPPCKGTVSPDCYDFFSSSSSFMIGSRLIGYKKGVVFAEIRRVVLHVYRSEFQWHKILLNLSLPVKRMYNKKRLTPKFFCKHEAIF